MILITQKFIPTSEFSEWDGTTSFITERVEHVEHAVEHTVEHVVSAQTYMYCRQLGSTYVRIENAADSYGVAT